MRNFIQRRVRTILRGRGRWLDAAANTEDIPVGDLIGPLRYDVIALRDFLRFYLAHQEMATTDFDAFVAAARRLRFYDWKFASHSVREPETTRSPEVFAPFFAAEVRQAVDVWTGLSGGFDPRHPIEVRVTNGLLPSTTGKRIRARYILGDGSHRLACLIMQGYTVLPRDYYRLRWFRSWRPFDATGILTSRRLLSEAEYCGFLSEILAAPAPLRARADLLRFVASARPQRLREIEALLRADGFPVPA